MLRQPCGQTGLLQAWDLPEADPGWRFIYKEYKELAPFSLEPMSVLPCSLSRSSLSASFFGQNSRGRKKEARTSQARVKKEAVLSILDRTLVVGAEN